MITGMRNNSTVLSSFVLILCFLAQKLYAIVRCLHAQTSMCWSCHPTFPWGLCVTSVSGDIFSHCTDKWYTWTLGIESSSRPDLLRVAWNFIITHNNGPWTGDSFSVGSARKLLFWKLCCSVHAAFPGKEPVLVWFPCTGLLSLLATGRTEFIDVPYVALGFFPSEP